MLSKHLYIQFLFFFNHSDTSSCPVALVGNSSIMTTSSRDSGHLYFAPDFSGNTSSVSPLNKILALGLNTSILL